MRRGFMSNRAAERMRIIEHWALAGAAAVTGGAAMLLLIDRLLDVVYWAIRTFVR